ncbi:hypothetical protein BZG36_00504 [Bifiguratus adelaidae]|uniref:PPPDE domain-containing protein n=1 Tax=Bifiguratus adelaidae TaxID=1938954 RepID=A0A261Y7F4_9FUNG|nr:hypothetical protein BZG36_00504 [Bifiguratus adelaidae]
MDFGAKPRSLPETRQIYPPTTEAQAYVESLLASKTAHKRLLKYDFLSKVYKVVLDNGDRITVKKVKPFNPLLRVLTAWAKNLFWKFVKQNTQKQQVMESVDALIRESEVYFQVCHHRTRCLGLHALVSQSFAAFINSQKSSMFAKEQLAAALYFARAVAYFHSRKIPLMDLDWKDFTFVKNLCEIGEILPFQLFYVTIVLRSDGAFKSAPHHAKYHITNAKVKAMTRIKSAKEQVTDKYRYLLLDQDLDADSGSQTPSLEGQQLGNSSTAVDDEKARVKLEELMEYKARVLEVKRNVVRKFTEQVAQLSPLDVQRALDNSTINLAKAFYRRIDSKAIKEEYDDLVTQVVAARNGLTVDVFAANPSLEEFSAKNSLHRYLMRYKHSLQVDPSTLDCKIMFEGEYRRWLDILPQINFMPNSMVMTGQYSRRGVTNKGFYDWTRLEPFINVEPTWGNRYLLEVCSWIVDEPRMGGDHTWIRLKTPTGDIYAMGFHEQFIFPMKIKPSKFMSPDICEFWRGPHTVCAFEITEKQFKRMRKQIEHDQKNREYTYQLFHGNCTRYAKSIAQIAGIDLPASVPLIKLFIPSPRVHKLARKVLNAKYTPPWVRPLLLKIWAVNINIFGLFWGSGLVDKEVKGDPVYRHVQPYIKDIYDLADTDKVITHHPFIVGHFVRLEIEAWREEQIRPLQNNVNQLRSRQSSLEAQLMRAEDSKNDRIADELRNEIAGLQSKVAELEKEIDHLKYVCPPKFLKPPAKVGLMKDNPWVGKTLVTEEEEEESSQIVATEQAAASAASSDQDIPAEAPVPRKRSIKPSDILLTQSDDGQINYQEVEPVSTPAATPSTPVLAPTPSIESPGSPYPLERNIFEQNFKNHDLFSRTVKGVYIGDGVSTDMVITPNDVEAIQG